MYEEKKQKLKEYQKVIVKLINAESLILIKKMHDYIHHKLLILLIVFSYLSFHCSNSIIWSQRCSDNLQWYIFILGLNENTRMKRKLTKYVLLLCTYYC